MTNILNEVAKSYRSEFRPASPDDYFALRLASALGEPVASSHYAVLASQYSEPVLLCAYRKAVDTNPDHSAPVFHEILTTSDIRGQRDLPRSRLMAIRIERRTVAMALFTGTHLEGWRVRQLPSDSKRAEASCVGFVREVLEEHQCDGAALESTTGDVARTTLHRGVTELCRELGVSVVEISRQTVIESFAYPAPRTREEVREIISEIWPLPDLKSGRICILDAFALGLYAQTERLFHSDLHR